MYRSISERKKTLTPDDVVGRGTAAGRDVPVTGDASASQVVLGSDSRLSGDTPLSLYDAHTILASTADNTPVAVAIGQQTLIGRITGGNITALSVGQITTLLGLGTAATKTSPISGNAAAGEVVLGSDTRLSGNAPTQSPSFTGTVSFPVGSPVIPAVSFPTRSITTEPVANSLEFDGSDLYVTNSVGVRKKRAFVET